jgi:hypothetical protein
MARMTRAAEKAALQALNAAPSIGKTAEAKKKSASAVIKAASAVSQAADKVVKAGKKAVLDQKQLEAKEKREARRDKVEGARKFFLGERELKEVNGKMKDVHKIGKFFRPNSADKKDTSKVHLHRRRGFEGSSVGPFSLSVLREGSQGAKKGVLRNAVARHRSLSDRRAREIFNEQWGPDMRENCMTGIRVLSKGPLGKRAPLKMGTIKKSLLDSGVLVSNIQRIYTDVRSRSNKRRGLVYGSFRDRAKGRELPTAFFPEGWKKMTPSARAKHQAAAAERRKVKQQDRQQALKDKIKHRRKQLREAAGLTVSA